MHAGKHVNVLEAYYSPGPDSNQIIGVQEICYDNTHEFVSILVSEELETDSVGLLTLKLSGIIYEKDIGIYRSAYYDLQNRTKYYLVSMFEAANARKAFPCFDEPEFIFYLNILELSNHLKRLI